MMENFLRHFADVSQTIIETIFRQQRTVLEGSLTLFGATAKSQDAFSLITLAKALQDIRKQLNNVTELLQLAQNKKNLVCFRFFSPPDQRCHKGDLRLTKNFEIVESSDIHPKRNQQSSYPRFHYCDCHLPPALLHDVLSRHEQYRYPQRCIHTASVLGTGYSTYNYCSSCSMDIGEVQTKV
jgi:hypothetical protein